MGYKILLVAEFEDIEPTAEQSASDLAQVKLDAFREAVLPSLEYGVTLYRPDGRDARELAREIDYPSPRAGEMVSCCGTCGLIDIQAEEAHVHILSGDVESNEGSTYCPECYDDEERGNDGDAGDHRGTWPSGAGCWCGRVHPLHREYEAPIDPAFHADCDCAPGAGHKVMDCPIVRGEV